MPNMENKQSLKRSPNRGRVTPLSVLFDVQQVAGLRYLARYQLWMLEDAGSATAETRRGPSMTDGPANVEKVDQSSSQPRQHSACRQLRREVSSHKHQGRNKNGNDR